MEFFLPKHSSLYRKNLSKENFRILLSTKKKFIEKIGDLLLFQCLKTMIKIILDFSETGL